MNMKIGAGGKLQNYDTKGRYCKTINPIIHPKEKPKEKSKIKMRLEYFNNVILKHANEMYLKDAFDVLCSICPREIQYANREIYKNGIRWGEIDLETTKVVIEVKGRIARGHYNQYIKEAGYAKIKHKDFLIFAPGISKVSKRQLLSKYNINVITTIEELKIKIKEIHNKGEK